MAESYEAVTGLNLDPDIAYRVRPASEVAQHMRAQANQRKQKRIDGEARVSKKTSQIIVLTYRSICIQIDPASVSALVFNFGGCYEIRSVYYSGLWHWY